MLVSSKQPLLHVLRTCSSTRAASCAGESVGYTGTTRWASMGPVSYSSSTKCTVGPEKLQAGGQARRSVRMVFALAQGGRELREMHAAITTTSTRREAV